MTKEQLAEIKAMRGAITGAPQGWEAGQKEEECGDKPWCVSTEAVDAEGVHDWVADYLREEDAAFIARAPAIVDALLAEVERLTVWAQYIRRHGDLWSQSVTTRALAGEQAPT